MRRTLPMLAVAAAVAFPACTGERPAAASPSPAALADALTAARSGRCASCHPGAEPTLGAPPPRLPLVEALPYRAGGALAAFLSRHHGGEDADALAAFLRGPVAAPLRPATLAAGAVGAGERRYRESGCAICHDDAAFADLAQRTDHAALVAFLRRPTQRRPDLAHDFGLDASAASELAAFLLRAQVDEADSQPQPGLRVECYELDLDDASLPDLESAAPSAVGIAETVDVSERTRNDSFALRFTGLLLVPVAGEWTLTLGSDDCSWLWVDGEKWIDNASVAPHRRRSTTRRLEAGAHEVRIVYTEIGGGQSLEFRWRGPGVEDGPVPASALSRQAIRLEPAAAPAAEVTAELRMRGERAFAARRCGACHTGGTAVEPAKPWNELGEGACSALPTDATRSSVAAMLRTAPPPEVALTSALRQHGCTSCHVRDGQGGVGPTARPQLVEVEDLGDEGRLPPDLTHVGRRLRPDWLVSVLTGERRARPYLKVQMPHLPQPLALAFAASFAAVDGAPEVDAESAFSAEMVERGRALVGVEGRNCASCHPFDGRRAIGPQGMDMAIQYERLRPAWFAEWLLHAATLRPGTRMPTLWGQDDASSRADVAAIRAWCALGGSAPVPKGYARSTEGLELDPIDRPVLHGAFLEGLSARCLAVGTPQRGHFAWDLEHGRLAWLWRGPFLDASGTWDGRAGKLVKPLGEDHVELDPLRLVDTAGGPEASRVRCLGQRRDAAGYPVIRFAVGDAEIEDHVAPALHPGGVQFERTITCTKGVVRVEAQPRSGRVNVRIGEEPAETRRIVAGQSLVLRYSW